MTKICPACESPIKDLDRVRTEVSATYHELDIKGVFALGQYDLEIAGPLYHERCLDEE